ncbi:uncharacterized protein LOC125742897 [Brienomyrus brachyistius]|uniref:uncharacterized protein LOC125742897 n=1 Tax=Brienomyrus brachyistius TaxID=42636 RepID=UPI0020B35AF0|nr:uncharacterized protein LOC125742897 [Brienomyrus brachyistius]
MSLPDYPAPELEVTLKEASRVLQLILSPEQYPQYINALQHEEEALQEAHQRISAAIAGCENWATAQFKSYILSCRDSLPSSRSIPMILPPVEAAKREDVQLERAATLLWAVARLHSEPWLVERDEPTERTQQSEVFAATRIPGKSQDYIQVYPESLHAILLCTGGIFPIQILHQSNPGEPMSPLSVNDIYTQLAEAARRPGVARGLEPSPFCSLSALPRQEWCAMREKIQAGGEAVATSLGRMESAVLAVALEDCSAPASLAETLNVVRLGRGEGHCLRYYDKVVNLVVFQDGGAGMLFEHSALDGMVAGLITYSVWCVSESLTVDPNPPLSRTTGSPNPRTLFAAKPLNVDVTNLLHSSPSSSPKDTNVIVTFEIPSYPDFLATLRSQRALFDAWVNFSLQLALRQTVGDSAMSYIFVTPTHMRHYKHGRCDPTYPVTTQSRHLVGTLMSCMGTSQSPPYTKALLRLFHVAFQEHKRLIKVTKKGQSVGPHLAALHRALPPGNPLRKFLDLFVSPSVYVTGKDFTEGLNGAVGNVYAFDQLALTYLGKKDSICLAINAKGSFANILSQLQKNLQEDLKVMMFLALRYAIAGQMEAIGCLLEEEEVEGQGGTDCGGLQAQFSHQGSDQADKKGPPPDAMLNSDFTLIIHGGAMDEMQMDENIVGMIQFSLQAALVLGTQELAGGGRSVNAVQKCVAALENCFLFNAGKGSVSKKGGRHEMEATIVDGTGLKSGSVACVHGVKNPVKAARKVLDNSPHALLAGQGVVDFLSQFGESDELAGDEYFQSSMWKELSAQGAGEHAWPQSVGAAALDCWGHLAAAASTGGTIGEGKGQVGQTAAVGAGVYADGTLAVVCSGSGDLLLSRMAAHKVASLYHDTDYSLREACQRVISEDLRGNCSGIIAVNDKGDTVIKNNAGVMFIGSMIGGQEHVEVLKPTA